MAKTNKDTQACIMIIGEWQAARDRAFEAARKFLSSFATQAVTIVRGDEVSETQVLEELKTKDLFSRKKVVIYREPDFFKADNNRRKNLANKVKQAFKDGNYKRAARLLGRMLCEKGFGPSDIDQGLSEAIKDLSKETGLMEEELEGLLKEYLDILKGSLSSKPSSGHLLLSWLKKERKRDGLLIIQVSEISKQMPIAKDFFNACKVVDLRLSTGKGRKSGESISRFLQAHLAPFGKNMEKAAMDEFVRLVGTSSLSAVKNELEKLLSLTGDSKTISKQDVQSLVVRHKEEEIFRLTEAFRKRELALCLSSLDLILEQGVHPLAVIASIRNAAIKIYALKCVAKELSISGRVSFNQFSSSLWPSFKDTFKDLELKNFARMHPYSAYLHLLAPYKIEKLLQILEELASLDLALKGSKLEPHFVLESFFFKHLSQITNE